MHFVKTKIVMFVNCFLMLSLITATNTIQVQAMTAQKIQSLAPDQQDLQGFTRLRPAGALLPKDVPLDGRLVAVPSPIAQTEDHVQTRADRTDNPPYWRQGTICDRVERTLYSDSGLYELDMTITLYDTPEVAKEDLKDSIRTSSGRFQPGSFTSPEAIGDESWFLPQNGKFKMLTFRLGRMVVLVEGSRSRLAITDLEFPPAAVEAVAYQILLRASQQAKLTGTAAQDTRLAVNGHALSNNALLVGKQTYVPVREFAKAMNLTSGWDAKTGALTLTGPKRKTVALTAGSTAAMVGGVKVAALAVPVLKDGGEPVMALSDLLALTGGRVTGYAGNTVQVKG